MRSQHLVFHCICLLAWTACTSDASETDELESPSGTVRDRDADSGRAGSAGEQARAEAGASPQGDASRPASPQADAGSADAQGAGPGQGSSAQDAGAGGPSSPSKDDARPEDSCPSTYATATLVQVDMSWPATIGYMGGEDSLLYWSKITYAEEADGTTLESAPCGLTIPVVTSTPLLDGALFANDMPVSAFDQPTMPRVAGRAQWQDGELLLDLGAVVIGASLRDPEAPWPFRDALPIADHDGDGKPGFTSIPRRDPPFALPPADITLTKHIDELYTAARLGLRLTGPGEGGCRGPITGAVEPVAFDYTVVGCHIVDGGECGDNEMNLYNNSKPEFTLGSRGQWKSVPIDESASCADVQNVLPPP